MHSAHRGEPVTLLSHVLDDSGDHRHRHSVRCLLIYAGRQRAFVRIDTAVGQQIQRRVEQLPIQLIHRQASPAPVLQDTQHRFGVLHFAYPPSPSLLFSLIWPASPCGQLSCPPWPDVTPATTTRPPSP